MTVIGEAVRSLPDEMKDREADVPWTAIVGVRNVLVHAYFGIEIDQVWRTIANDLPALEEAIGRLLEETL